MLCNFASPWQILPDRLNFWRKNICKIAIILKKIYELLAAQGRYCLIDCLHVVLNTKIRLVKVGFYPKICYELLAAQGRYCLIDRQLLRPTKAVGQILRRRIHKKANMKKLRTIKRQDPQILQSIENKNQARQVWKIEKLVTETGFRL